MTKNDSAKEYFNEYIIGVKRFFPMSKETEALMKMSYLEGFNQHGEEM